MMTAAQVRQELAESNAALEELKREIPKRPRVISARIGWIDALQHVLGEDPDEEPDE